MPPAEHDVYKATVALSDAERMELYFPDPVAYDIFGKILKGTTYPFDLLSSMLGAEAKTIVDIGANAGGFSLVAARQWPGSTVLAFEPGKKASLCLARNLAHIKSARVFSFGLARGDHRLLLHSHDYGTVCASVGEAGINNPTGETVELRDAGRTLQEMGVAAIDILKIDTEGCEVPILRSLEALLPVVRALLIEYHKEDDRRTIDNLLAATHHLCRGTVTAPHRGELCFISRSVLGDSMESIRIDLPEALAS